MAKRHIDGIGTKAQGQTPASHTSGYDEVSAKKQAQIEAAKADSARKAANPNQKYGAQRSGAQV